MLALALVALIAIGQSREDNEPAPTTTTTLRPKSPPARPAPRPAAAPRTTVTGTARRFAADWLDYLAGRRPASAVRGASPSLLVAFAGGARRDPIGPGKEGLRKVVCGPLRAGRRECRASVAKLPAIRFTVAAHGRPRVIALALD